MNKAEKKRVKQIMDNCINEDWLKKQTEALIKEHNLEIGDAWTHGLISTAIPIIIMQVTLNVLSYVTDKEYWTTIKNAEVIK